MDNQLERLVNKATDATLTADNWQYILDVCDYISSKPENATKQAIKLLTMRLNSKDANVILRTLSLITATAENCGSRMKQEIATKSFLHDGLLKKLNDKKLHQTVKYQIADVIKQLNESFTNDPSLKPANDAYKILLSDYKQYANHGNNMSSSGPLKPAKQELSQLDKQKEEQDLERVLKLSLQEYERDRSVKQAYLNEKPLPEAKQEQEQEPQPTAEPTSLTENEGQTIATVSKVRALYDLISYEQDELSFRKGDIITVIESVYRDWWRGSLPNGKVGIFPLNYVTPIVNKLPQEIDKELQVENDILTQDLKKIDQLLALLSSNLQDANEDEITQLYNDIIPLKPSLAKFIEKYSARKEELMNINNQINVQVKYYNSLMDSQINQKIHHQNDHFSTPYPDYTQLRMQPTSSGFGNEYPPQLQPPQQRHPQLPSYPQI